MVTCAPPSAALSAFSAKWDLRSRSVNQKLGNKENLLLIQITQHLYNHISIQSQEEKILRPRRGNPIRALIS